MDAPPPIGSKIKRARERLRMSQQQLADALGVTQKTIDNWEHDRSYPRSAIGALEDVLGVRLSDEPEPEPEPEGDQLDQLEAQLRDILSKLERRRERRRQGGDFNADIRRYGT